MDHRDVEFSFYMVFSFDGLSPPKKTHGTKQQAQEEAKRLAIKHGGKFFVMQAVQVAERVDVTVKDLENIPF